MTAATTMPATATLTRESSKRDGWRSEQVRWLNPAWSDTRDVFVEYQVGAVDHVVVIPEGTNALRCSLVEHTYECVAVAHRCEVWVKAS